ncbi:hypothetical protein Tco_0420460 [Tanacetum coccineum]
MNSIEQCIIERASHEQELKMTLKKLSERQLQIQQCKVQEVQSSVTSSGDETSSGIVSDEEIDKKELEAHYSYWAIVCSFANARSMVNSVVMVDWRVNRVDEDGNVFDALSGSVSCGGWAGSGGGELIAGSQMSIKQSGVNERLWYDGYEVSKPRQRVEYPMERLGEMRRNDPAAERGRRTCKDLDDERARTVRNPVLLVSNGKKDDSNFIIDSSNICISDNQVDQNAAECVDERAALANLIANLTFDMEENKTIPIDTSGSWKTEFSPMREETEVNLEKESRSKLYKDKVKPYDYTYQNSLYETFKPPSKTYLDQLERAKEVRKTIHCFVHELKTEMHDDLEYVKSLEKEIDELESEKADFSNIYDLLLEREYQASVFMEMMSVHISSGLVLHQMTSDHNRSELGIQDHSNEPSSSKLVPKVVP